MSLPGDSGHFIQLVLPGSINTVTSSLGSAIFSAPRGSGGGGGGGFGGGGAPEAASAVVAAEAGKPL